jgi:DNA replication protein DnaC
MKGVETKKQEALEVLRYKKAGIERKWWDKELKDYTGVSKHITSYIEEYTGKLNSKYGRGFIITGVNGIGKTMLMNIVAKKAVNRGLNVIVVPYWIIVSEYIKGWDDSNLFGKMLRADMLAVNDFGKSFEATEKSKLMAVTAIEFLLDIFIQRRRRVLMTTNIKITDIRGLYGDSIASKLNEACDFLVMREEKGDDFRFNFTNVIK